MENRFAGAQNQGERRRRRLASHDDVPIDDQLTADSAEFVQSAAAVPGGRHRFPIVAIGLISRVISRHAWKHFCVLALLGTVLAAVSWAVATGSLQLPAWRRTELAHSVSGILLLLAGQLSFLVGWVRAESAVDFRGRYRWWKWLAVAFCGSGLLMVTDTLATLELTLIAGVEGMAGPIQAARRTIVMVPTLGGLILVLSRVLPDMGRSFWSQSCLVTAVLGFSLRQMLMLTDTNRTIHPAVLDGLVVHVAFFSFAAILLHAHFVTYLSNDPPATQATSREAVRRTPVTP